MSEEKNEALEQEAEVKEETQEDNATNEDTQVDEASFPGAGKNKEPIRSNFWRYPI